MSLSSWNSKPGETARRRRAAQRAVPTPKSKEDWKPGMKCHWWVRTKTDRIKYPFYRLSTMLHLIIGVAYGVYRGMDTIGTISKNPAIITYQAVFLFMEMLNLFAAFLRLLETWTLIRRRSIDFKMIPNELLATPHPFGRKHNVPSEYANYPSVGVFIPCYKEPAALVLETVVGALSIDYPHQLLTVYLCDDGEDNAKRTMVSQLRKVHRNLHYVVRPVHSHAKSGNLNYALKRTRSDLIVTFDADFVARPQFLQRLMPYYYNFNPETSLYEFDQSLACVQSPQHFRNLHAKDSDPLDQRATSFFDMILPGKDYWNASSIIGTNNLLSRVPVSDVGFYPYFTVTEDTAMSMAFHSKGYTTYFVNEGLATGLATTSLWSNLGQRARWLKGDYQILFSWKYGPLTRKGLSFVQRMLYLHMSYSRFTSMIHFFFEIALILLLVFSIPPLDVDEPAKFIIALSAFVFSGVLMRFAAGLGNEGLSKSFAGSVAFEAVFRYYTMKHFVTVMLFGKKLKFKVTDKSDSKPVGPGQFFDEESRNSVLGEEPRRPANAAKKKRANAGTPTTTDISSGDDSSARSGDEGGIKMDQGKKDVKRRPGVETDDEPARSRWYEISRNLQRVWFNFLMTAILTFTLVWAILFPPSPYGENRDPFAQVKNRGVREREDFYPIVLSLAFVIVSIIPHLLAIFLAFVKYTSGWMLTDLKDGRCDQFVEKENGKVYVPWTFYMLVPLIKALIITAAIVFMIIYLLKPDWFGDEFGTGTSSG